MALTIEDGSIVTGAESYATVAEADTYHTNRGNAAWTGTDAVKEAALRKAASYLYGEYRNRWKGYRVAPLTQAMEWPRMNVTVDDGGYSLTFNDQLYLGPICLASDAIPPRLKDAQCELASRALAGELAADTGAKIKRETVDVITTEYFNGEDPGKVRYLAVEQLISDLLRPKGSVDVLRG